MSHPPIVLSVHNLITKIRTTTLHDHLSFSIHQGEIFGIVGGSGSGKTVLLNTILGLMPHHSGTIKIFDTEHAVAMRSMDVKKRMGVLFQHGALFSSLTVLQNICVPILEQSDVPKTVAQEIAYYKLQLVGLPQTAAEKLPEELSGGMIKRVALARALALDAKLLFLDEPTSGLDPISAEAFDNLIKTLQSALGLTVIMITHDLGSLAMCDRIGVIINKKLLVGTVPEIRQNGDPWIQEYFHNRRANAVLERT